MLNTLKQKRALKMNILFKGRPVHVVVSGSLEEPFIEEAFFDDQTGDPLSDDEVEEVYAGFGAELEEAAFQNCVMRAEDAWEGDR